MKKYLFGFVGIMVGVNCLALDVLKSSANGNVTNDQVSSEDRVAIESFFKEFRAACNEKDIEKAKKMLGRNWNYWASNIQNGIKFDSIEILDMFTTGATTVVTKVSAVDRHGDRSSPKIVFTVNKYDGEYFIEKIAVPEVDERNQEIKNAGIIIEKLIVAINAKDMDGVRATLSFGDAINFEDELLSRSLLWIKAIVDNGVKIPLEDIEVHREGKDVIIGKIFVPCAPGGTNVLQRFIFKDGKIDRAAPRNETKEEFMKRFKAEKEKSRKQWEEREAARRKQLNEQFIEQLRKQQRNGAGAK